MANSGAVIGRGIAVFNASAGGGGTLTGANNGLSLSGTIAQLGGTLLKNTTIAGANFKLTVNNVLGGNSSDVVFQPSGPALEAYASAFPGLITSLQVTNNGIYVNDTLNNIGIIGQQVWPYTLDNNTQYAQYGRTGVLAGSVQNLAIVATGNTDLLICNVNAGKNQLLRIDPAIFLNSLGASTITVTLRYTDAGGTVVSTQIASLTTLTTVTYPSLTIYAQKNTTVVLRVNINVLGASVQALASAWYLMLDN